MDVTIIGIENLRFSHKICLNPCVTFPTYIASTHMLHSDIWMLILQHQTPEVFNSNSHSHVCGDACGYDDWLRNAIRIIFRHRPTPEVLNSNRVMDVTFPFVFTTMWQLLPEKWLRNALSHVCGEN
jgi:hypothetical protein